MSKLRRIGVLAWRHWPALLRSTAIVLAFRIGLSIFPYRRLKRWIPAPSGPVVDEDRLRVLMWSIHQAARVVPRASCLTQALAAQYLCAREGLATHIRVGVTKDDGRIRAHAWLIAGKTILIGGSDENLGDFTPIVDLGHVSS